MAQVGEAGFEVLVFDVEGVDSGFGGFDLVEVLVDDGGLGFSEADEVDDVREDFDETVVGRFEEVGEGEVVDAALLGNPGQFRGILHADLYIGAEPTSTSSFLSDE